MAKARKNPIGTPAPKGITLVQVGPYGKLVHVYDPQGDIHLCRSGKNAGRVGEHGDRRGGPQALFRTKSKFITCYRCQKLATLNMDAGRPAWKGP